MKNKRKINASIAYEGKVNIELRKGKETISKYSYHNEGNLPLFLFLTHCLRGDYNEVESLRPKFIKVFSIGAAGSVNPYPDVYSNFNALVNAPSTNLLSLTSPIYSGGVDITDNGNPPSSSVHFKFVIPFSQLSSYSNINMLALYSSTYKGGSTNASMFIIIEDKDAHILKDLLTEMNISIDGTNNNDYNLFIEWVTTIKNEGE